MTPDAQRHAGLPPWPSPAVEQLCRQDDRFERVSADETFARDVLEHVADDGEVVLFAAASGRWAKAHTLSYDAARKSMEALLLARGWRVTSRRGGGHQAVAAVVDAWLSSAAPPGPRMAHKFAERSSRATARSTRIRVTTPELIGSCASSRWTTSGS